MMAQCKPPCATRVKVKLKKGRGAQGKAKQRHSMSICNAQSVGREKRQHGGRATFVIGNALSGLAHSRGSVFVVRQVSFGQISGSF
jgi:hypothetical protein